MKGLGGGDTLQGGNEASYCHVSAATSRTSDGPLGVYLSKVEAGELQQDSHQQKVVERLQSLHYDLMTYSPDQHTDSWLSKVRCLKLFCTTPVINFWVRL